MGDGMADLSLSQAARLTGRSKSTIGRAIKSGRLSATRNEDGTFGINPAELLRAFPKGGPDTALVGVDEPSRNHLHGTSGTGLETDEIKALRDDLAKAEQRAAVAEAQAEERARALDAAERNLSDLRRLLPLYSTHDAVSEIKRPWWKMFHKFNK